MMHFSETTPINAPIRRCFDLARSVEVHLLANIHSGEQAVAGNGVTSGLVGFSERVTWRGRHFGFRHDLTSEITAFESPVYFQVTMVRGIFRFMQADHTFQMLSPGVTEMKDIFSIAAPLSTVGRLAEVVFLKRYMVALQRERSSTIKGLAESGAWHKYLPAPEREGELLS